MHIFLGKVKCKFSKGIWTIYEFSQIYSFPECLKSETTKEFNYGLQPLSAGVGRKITFRATFSHHVGRKNYFLSHFYRPIKKAKKKEKITDKRKEMK